MKRLKYIFSLGLILAAPLLSAPLAYAASGSISLVPGSTSVTVGNNFSVVIHENSGTTLVNAVQTDLSFPASLLSVNSVTAGSAWGVVAQNQYNNTSGTINLAVGNITPLGGDQVVGTISFHAKAGGTANVTFNTSTTKVLEASDNQPLTLTYNNGSYTLVNPVSPPPPPPPPPPPTPPPPPPSPHPSPPPPPSFKKKAAPKPSPVASPSGTKISDVNITDIGPDTATINWKTSAAADSQVDYGLDVGSYTYVASDPKLVTDHKVVLSSELIQPGVTYHFMVKSTDAKGGTANSTDYTFTTKGVAIEVTVLNKKNNKPVSGAKVSISYPTLSKADLSTIDGNTDKDGKVTLSGFPVSIENASVAITYGGKTTTFNNIQIKPYDPKNPTQTLSFTIDAKKTPPLVYVIIPLLLLLALIWLLRRRGHRGNPDDFNHHFPDVPAPPPTENSGSSAGTNSGPTIIRPTTTGSA